MINIKEFLDANDLNELDYYTGKDQVIRFYEESNATLFLEWLTDKLNIPEDKTNENHN